MDTASISCYTLLSDGNALTQEIEPMARTLRRDTSEPRVDRIIGKHGEWAKHTRNAGGRRTVNRRSRAASRQAMRDAKRAHG